MLPSGHVHLTLNQKIGALLLRLATSEPDRARIAHALEVDTDPSEKIARILYEGRKHLCPAMMPGYRRGGTTKLRLR